MPIRTILSSQMDPLLSKKFCMHSHANTIDVDLIQDEQSIKNKVYNGENAVYLTTTHSEEEFISFFKDHPDQYNKIVDQLFIVRNKIIHWASTHKIENSRTLVNALSALHSPNQSKRELFKPFYKKQLEMLVIALDDERIDLSVRKNALASLFSEYRLSSYIDSMYGRIEKTILQLKQNCHSTHLAKCWLQNYLTKIAKQLTEQTPYPLVISYSAWICSLLNISSDTNIIYASYYLMQKLASQMKIKLYLSYNFGIQSVIKKSLNQQTINVKEQVQKVVEKYIQHFVQIVTTEKLVSDLSQKTHVVLQKIMSSTTQTAHEKIIQIQALLNQFGEDRSFSLDECLDYSPSGEIQLKPYSYLIPTITERCIRNHFINTPQESHFDPHHDRIFYNRFALSWIQQEGKKQSIINLIKQGSIESIQNWMMNELIFKTRMLDSMIHTQKDLLTLIDSIHLLDAAQPKLSQLVTPELIERLTEHWESSTLFTQALSQLSAQNQKILTKTINPLKMQKIISSSIQEANIPYRFSEFSDFLTENPHYINRSTLENTARLPIQYALNLNYRNFANMHFPRLEIPCMRPPNILINYFVDLNFNQCDFSATEIQQPIHNINFNQAKFYKTIIHNLTGIISLTELNLMELTLLDTHSLSNTSDLVLSIKKSTLSSSWMIFCLRIGISDFSETDLTQVDFQTLVNPKRYKTHQLPTSAIILNFKNANLAQCNLAQFDFTNVDFEKATLIETNLVGVQFNPNRIQGLSISGSTLTINLVDQLAQSGIQNFNGCNILSYFSEGTKIKKIELQNRNFQRTKWIGTFDKVGVYSSNLADARFTALSPDDALTSSHQTIPFRLKIKNSTLTNIHFTGYLRISVKRIPELYAQGGTDFRNIKMVGTLPNPQSFQPKAFPNIKISPQGYSHFAQQNIFFNPIQQVDAPSIAWTEYQQKHKIGLSNLTSYYPETIRCSSHDSRRRKRSPAFPCAAYFFIYTGHQADALKTLQQNINTLPTQPNAFYIILTLWDQLNIYPVDQLNEVHFFLFPNREDQISLHLFNAIKQRFSLEQHSHIAINIHYIIDPKNPIDLDATASTLKYIGFKKGMLTTFNPHDQKWQKFSIDQMNSNPIPQNIKKLIPLLLSLTTIHPSIPHIPKIDHAQEANPSILNQPKIKDNHKSDRSLNKAKALYHIALHIRHMYRKTGSTKGGKFEIGRGLMEIIAQAIIQAFEKEITPTILTGGEKAELREFAEQQVNESIKNGKYGTWVAETRGEKILTAAVNCIQQGLCIHQQAVLNKMEETLNLIYSSRDYAVTLEIILTKIGRFFSKWANQSLAIKIMQGDQAAHPEDLNITDTHPVALTESALNNHTLYFAQQLNISLTTLKHWYPSAAKTQILQQIHEALTELSHDYQETLPDLPQYFFSTLLDRVKEVLNQMIEPDSNHIENQITQWLNNETFCERVLYNQTLLSLSMIADPFNGSTTQPISITESNTTSISDVLEENETDPTEPLLNLSLTASARNDRSALFFHSILEAQLNNRSAYSTSKTHSTTTYAYTSLAAAVSALLFTGLGLGATLVIYRHCRSLSPAISGPVILPLLPMNSAQAQFLFQERKAAPTQALLHDRSISITNPRVKIKPLLIDPYTTTILYPKTSPWKWIRFHSETQQLITSHQDQDQSWQCAPHQHHYWVCSITDSSKMREQTWPHPQQDRFLCLLQGLHEFHRWMLNDQFLHTKIGDLFAHFGWRIRWQQGDVDSLSRRILSCSGQGIRFHSFGAILINVLSLHAKTQDIYLRLIQWVRRYAHHLTPAQWELSSDFSLHVFISGAHIGADWLQFGHLPRILLLHATPHLSTTLPSPLSQWKGLIPPLIHYWQLSEDIHSPVWCGIAWSLPYLSQLLQHKGYSLQQVLPSIIQTLCSNLFSLYAILLPCLIYKMMIQSEDLMEDPHPLPSLFIHTLMLALLPSILHKTLTHFFGPFKEDPDRLTASRLKQAQSSTSKLFFIPRLQKTRPNQIVPSYPI